MMKRRCATGFTLVELTIVIAIFGILAGLVIANINFGKHNQILREAALTLIDDIRATQNMTLVGTTVGMCHVYDDSGTAADVLDDVLQKVGENCDIATSTCDATGGDYAACEAVVPEGGYGIYIDSSDLNAYTLFADYGDGDRNEVTGIPAYYEGPGQTDSLVKKITLPDGVQIIGVQAVGQFTQNAGLDPYVSSCLVEGANITLLPPANSPDDDVSFAWIPPEAKLYGIVHSELLGATGICPDYIFRILLQQTRTDSCRIITVNGASGLVDEQSVNPCAFP